MENALSGRVLAGTICVTEEEDDYEEGTSLRSRHSRSGRYMAVGDGMQQMLRKRPKTYDVEEHE